MANKESQPTSGKPVLPVVTPPPVQTTGPEPAAPAAEALKSEAPKVIVLVDDKGKLTAEGRDQLSEALAAAAESLARGLRAIIGNQIDPGQAVRGALENAFEAANKAANGRAGVKDLVDASKAQATLVDVLANHTLKDGRELLWAKHAANQSAAVAKLLLPK